MIKLNGVQLSEKTFPNGETLVNGEEVWGLIKTYNHIFFKYENDADLIKLMFLKKHLDADNHFCDLEIAYMPYSRMDRIEGFSVFTLKYVCDFINQLKFNGVSVHEAHSDITAALLENVVILDTTSSLLCEVKEIVEFDPEVDYIFYPDAGAQKRYGKQIEKNELVGFKKRDFKTGKISSLKVIGEMEPGRKVIIVDDLSSRGGTFMFSATELKKLGAGEIFLVVAHCENTIFEGSIPESDLIKKVYTTNSIISESKHKKVEIIRHLGDK